MTPAALLILGAALLVAGGRVGRARLGQLTAPLSRGAGDQVALRPTWVLVAVLAFGACGWIAGDGPAGAVIGAATAGAGGWLLRRAIGDDGERIDAAALAGAWELLAICLVAGLPVAAAVNAAAAPLTGAAGGHLRRVAGLLELGADPAAAWESLQHRPALAAFARAAGRSAGTGAALAQVARAQSEHIRAGMVDEAEARAQRAAVLIAGPLGLCFLPAFLVLGIAPVVIGLAGEALARW